MLIRVNDTFVDARFGTEIKLKVRLPSRECHQRLGVEAPLHLLGGFEIESLLLLCSEMVTCTGKAFRRWGLFKSILFDDLE